MVALAACVAANLSVVVADWMEIDLFNRVLEGEPVPQSELDADDNRQAVAALVYFATIVLGAVFFLRWFHLAYRNLGELAPDERRYGTGWAVGAWFFPILNLWRPKKIANDLWRGSDPVGGASRPGLLLAAWWAAWLVGWFLGSAAGFVDEGTVVTSRDSARVDLAASAVLIVAALLAVAVVRTITQRETLRAGSTSPVMAPTTA